MQKNINFSIIEKAVASKDTCPICKMHVKSGKFYNFAGYALMLCPGCMTVHAKLMADNKRIYTDDFISLFEEKSYEFSGGRIKFLKGRSFNRDWGHNYNFHPLSLGKFYARLGQRIHDAFCADTPIRRLPDLGKLTKAALRLLYLINRLVPKGKIVCHVLSC